MNFKIYNDYELLYLIGEGSEAALNILYKKYFILISKLSYKYIIGDKREDLVQEGIILFFNSITRYREDSNISFYIYIRLIIERRFSYLTKKCHYYDSTLVFNDSIVDEIIERPISNLERMARKILSTELDKQIYEWCIINGESVKHFSERTGNNINSVSYRKKQLIKELKNILT